MQLIVEPLCEMLIMLQRLLERFVTHQGSDNDIQQQIFTILQQSRIDWFEDQIIPLIVQVGREVD
ncbi:hypothetical protein D3C80_2146080 [compost metagenome]